MREKTLRRRPKVLGPVFLLTFVAGLPIIAGGQPRIENPARPLAKNAGRVVRLEEVLRIRDDGAQVIFRAPHDLTLGPDGSLYFTDYADAPALYRFSPKGELIFKMLKKGQGPGEVLNAAGYLVGPERIRVLAWIPPKIMDFSPDGRYLGEARVEEDTHGLWFLRQSEGKIYGIRDELFSSDAFRTSKKFTAFSVLNRVYEISPDFKTWKKLYEFPVRMMVKQGRGFRLDPIDARIVGSTLYIVHTAEYQVTAFDLHAGRVKHILTRAYDRVRSKPARDEDLDPEARGIDTPEEPFAWDIERIQAAARRLWIFTSAHTPDGNSQAVDLFDEAGRYADSIVLRYPDAKRTHNARWTHLTDDGFFFIPEEEADGLITIAKYRITEAGLFGVQAVPKRAP